MTKTEIYADKIRLFTQELKSIKKLLLASSMLRLAVFILIFVGVYFLWGNTQLIIAEILIGLTLFFYLVSRHVNLQQKKNKLEALIHINENEIEILKGNFSHLPNGKKYENPKHEFSQDVDLFGEKSFFQYLNRTALEQGEKKLVEILTENSIDEIIEKQEAIKDLSEKIEFRQEFSALSLLTKTEEDETENPQKNLEVLQNHSFFTPKKARLFSWVFTGISAGLILAYLTDIILVGWLVLWFFLGLLISGFYVKKVNLLSAQISKMQKVFRQYYQLVKLIENTEFTAEKTLKNQQLFSSSTRKASLILQDFSKAIDALDQRNNLLFGFLGNGLLLWDLRQAARLEKWMKNNIDQVEIWFKVIAEIDAYNTLGNFAFNHQQYTFPKITDSKTILNAKNAVHPLIPEKEAVANDVKIEKEDFLIITGANMAGKSTFLRTISLQILMSNIGLPVRTSFCEYTPIKLITSMRTVDSLAEESSYFYAELSRLKFIVDQLKTDKYFIVLDEILKGTNSKDKAIGSRKFLEKLVASHSTGIIATHDLSLCEVSDKLPQVKNHYFDAEIIDDELYFDYKFKKGICQNMNASFLLRKMEIVEE